MRKSPSRRGFLRAGALCCLAPGAIRAEPFRARPGEPVFLLEDSVVHDWWALRRRVNPPVRSSRNPIIVKDRDWEGSGPYLYGSVLYDARDKLFKCWYTVFHDDEYRASAPGSYLVCYAVSRDGYQWEKPELGVFEWKGSRRNNYIRLGRKYVGSITVVAPPPEAGIRRRFVAAYLDSPGICLAYSDDGIVWQEHARNPIDARHSDTHNSIVYDPVRGLWMVHHRPGLYAGPSKRRIAVIESRDLETWTEPEVVLLPDESDVPEFYGMPVFQRGNLFFGLLQIYDRPAGRIEIELVFSPDGRRWHRVPPRELFLVRGQAGEFDRGMVLTASGPVIAHGEMRFYYGGCSVDHNQRMPNDVPVMAIGMASVPLDRMFGLTTSDPEAPGVLLTRPLQLSGKTLELNAAVEGRIRVALLDRAGKSLPGFELEKCRTIKGNELRHGVSWGQKSLPPEPVRMKFQLERATLYAFYVR